MHSCLPLSLSHTQVHILYDPHVHVNTPAQSAGRGSTAFHTVLYFKENPTTEDAYILRILESRLVVLVPRFGIEVRAWVGGGGGGGSVFKKGGGGVAFLCLDRPVRHHLPTERPTNESIHGPSHNPPNLNLNVILQGSIDLRALADKGLLQRDPEGHTMTAPGAYPIYLPSCHRPNALVFSMHPPTRLAWSTAHTSTAHKNTDYPPPPPPCPRASHTPTKRNKTPKHHRQRRLSRLRPDPRAHPRGGRRGQPGRGRVRAAGAHGPWAAGAGGGGRGGWGNKEEAVGGWEGGGLMDWGVGMSVELLVVQETEGREGGRSVGRMPKKEETPNLESSDTFSGS